jgi:hypothetical protein
MECTGAKLRTASAHGTGPEPMRSFVRDELCCIGGRFEAADRRAKQAATLADREQAEEEARAAEGDYWAAEMELADLVLLLLRQATAHRRDALRMYLLEILGDEIVEIAVAAAKGMVGQ